MDYWKIKKALQVDIKLVFPEMKYASCNGKKFAVGDYIL
jgi:hypothetical protein